MDNETQLRLTEIKLKVVLLVMILFSVLTAAGIPMIVIGAVNSWFWLMVPGIVFTVTGFYGLPVGWSAWGAAVGRKNILRIIVQEELTLVADIAAASGKSVASVKSNIDRLLTYGRLRGYKLNPDKTSLIKLVKQEKKAGFKCMNCNAPVSGKQDSCEYCGAYLK